MESRADDPRDELLERLQRRIDELEARMARVEPGSGRSAGGDPDGTPSDGSLISRRGLIAGAAAAVAGAGLAMLPGGAAETEAATGGDMILGGINDALTVTELRPTGSSTPPILFIANSTASDPSASLIPAALAGWSGLGRTGVYAYSQQLPALYASTGSQNVAALRMSPWNGPPTANGHGVGEYVGQSNGAIWACVAPGTPGTWANVGFNPIAPSRVLDTRDGTGLTGKQQAGNANVRSLKINGTPAIPIAAQAVIMNVTVTQPSQAAFLTIWPSDVARPTASNLNVLANQTIPNLVAVKLGAVTSGANAGKVSIFLSQGSAHVIFDVAGYFI